ncbi:MAG: glycosyltransferase [Planctomycetota bacterium]|nr:glycosyltransferase [Planctomycetota bacterium]
MAIDQMFWLMVPVLLIDLPRYSLGLTAMCLWDMLCELVYGSEEVRSYEYCPTVSLVIAGLNEGDTIHATLASIWGTYPRMEIIVVDDGSSDKMTAISQDFAKRHAGVLVLTKPHRGGKSSALNFALPFANGEVVVCVDGDSDLSEGAIWEIVQPFADPQVGAVSGAVVGRNPFVNLCTWCQAYEYLRCIFVGRMFAARMGILGVISGAFGAYRRTALQRVMGWDVGPGEDGDLTLRMRKGGYRIAFQPYAQCRTNLPTKWWTLIKQRRRWEWAAITFECRKHVDMGNVFSPNFRWSNLGVLLDRWIFNVLLVYLLWGYVVWVCFHLHADTWKQFLLYYICYILSDIVILTVVLYYSTNRRRDLLVGLSLPFTPFYNVLQKAVSLWAITEEIFSRRSFRDGFVPEHVRQATWHW